MGENIEGRDGLTWSCKHQTLGEWIIERGIICKEDGEGNPERRKN